MAQPSTGVAKGQLATIISTYWSWVAVIALAFVLWMPRLRGPLDLRWDGGVYYLLGTSLATGHGYRILSEPGLPEAVQYPPLLPAFVALHQKISGTIDPAVIASRLRLSYAVMFVGYAVAVLALAKKFLSVPFAVLATALCLSHHITIFLSDLLFAELPFALVSVAFAVVAISPRLALNGWARGIASFALATAGFLLKTVGIVLFLAWIAEALLQRRWKTAIGRSSLMLLPLVLWNVHVARVRSSDEYAHPAYQYQRAPYQYSNVTYAENASLRNPFQPELGKMNARALGERLVKNLPWLVMGAGETLSSGADSWPLRRLQTRLLRHRVTADAQESLDITPMGAGNAQQSFVTTYLFIGIPILAFAMLAFFGLVILLRQKSWLMPLIVLGMLAMVWLTPWRVQFTRYLMPLMPFLTICMFVGFLKSYYSLQSAGSYRPVARLALIALLLICCAMHVFVPIKLFRSRAVAAGVFRANGLGAAPRFFAHDLSWQSWEEAANWIAANTPPDAIVATSAPHMLYLLTGRRAVLPPMEIDPNREQQLLEAVPAEYVIIDQLKALDVTRRYVLPAVNAVDGWQLVHAVRATSIYQYVADREQ